MSARFEWYGGQVIASVEAAKKTALTAACKIVQADAKADAPKNTGNLQGSITYKVSEDDGKVGTNVEYAIYQEYGFRHWRSGKFIQNAYLRPALDNNRAKIIKLINDFVGAALTKLNEVETVSATLVEKVEALEVKTAEPIKEPVLTK